MKFISGRVLVMVIILFQSLSQIPALFSSGTAKIMIHFHSIIVLPSLLLMLVVTAIKLFIVGRIEFLHSTLALYRPLWTSSFTCGCRHRIHLQGIVVPPPVRPSFLSLGDWCSSVSVGPLLSTAEEFWCWQVAKWKPFRPDFSFLLYFSPATTIRFIC